MDNNDATALYVKACGKVMMLVLKKAQERKPEFVEVLQEALES